MIITVFADSGMDEYRLKHVIQNQAELSELPLAKAGGAPTLNERGLFDRV